MARSAIHPGKHLGEQLKALGMSAAELTHPMFSTRDFKAVPAKYRALVPEYIKDYVSLNQFAV